MPKDPFELISPMSQMKVYEADLGDDYEPRKQIVSPQTPLAKAAVDLLARAQVVLDNAPEGLVKIYIFGGCAVHMLTNSRGSGDIDAEVVGAGMIKVNDIKLVYEQPESYETQDGDVGQVNFDFKFNNALGPLHEDYTERAIPVEGFEPGSSLQIYIASGVDIAISKLDRFTDQDKSDIENLMRCGRVKPQHLQKLGLEAIDIAIGNQNMMRINLNEVLEPYLENENDTPEP